MHGPHEGAARRSRCPHHRDRSGAPSDRCRIARFDRAGLLEQRAVAPIERRTRHGRSPTANEARSLSDMRRVALASAALAFCLPAQWVAGASAAVACLTAATGRRLGASARLGVAIVASATRLDSTLSQELPHALARVMAQIRRLNARLASRKCDRPRSRQSTAC